MSQSILIGVDASTPSRSALLWSVDRAARTHSSLELLHVVEGDELASARTAGADLLRAELACARARAANLTITTNLVDGPAEAALVRRSHGHDLLVVGTHKTGFIYGRTFGSRFLGLAWRASCDVAFVPDQGGIARRVVVAAAESSPAGEAVIQFAAREAEATGNELILVAGNRDDAAAAAQLVRATHPDLQFRTRSTGLPLAEALIDSSARAALLVIGQPAAAGASAVNHDVLVNMGCPVLVVRRG
jgi:nucleotide-binding universal stress UspA family protein